MNKPRRGRLIAIAMAGGVAIVAAAIFLLAGRAPAERSVAGMVRQTEIRVAPEITGRLTEVLVKPGQAVRKGEVLAVLQNPELEATLGEAEAAARSARAERDHVYAGVRAEQVAVLAESVRTAEASLKLAEQEDARAVALAARDFTSRQSLDERNAALVKARADLVLKRAQLAAAQAGPTVEERALADARVALADAKVADLKARLAKAKLVAPIDGTVGIQVGEKGEVVPVGKPILTIDVGGQKWFAFTLREDVLRGLTAGSETALLTDDGRRIPAKVTELRPLGEFATWRAARAVGDHDLNSFRLRLDPTDAKELDLQPGMTVWLSTKK